MGFSLSHGSHGAPFIETLFSPQFSHEVDSMFGCLPSPHAAQYPFEPADPAGQVPQAVAAEPFANLVG